MRRPRPKFKVSFSYIILLFLDQYYSNKLWKHQQKLQRIISDSCFQLKLRLNIDARAPSIPLLNFPFKHVSKILEIILSFHPVKKSYLRRLSYKRNSFQISVNFIPKIFLLFEMDSTILWVKFCSTEAKTVLSISTYWIQLCYIKIVISWSTIYYFSYVILFTLPSTQRSSRWPDSRRDYTTRNWVVVGRAALRRQAWSRGTLWVRPIGHAE